MLLGVVGTVTITFHEFTAKFCFERMFTARRSYASAVLGVVILSVCHTRDL